MSLDNAPFRYERKFLSHRIDFVIVLSSESSIEMSRIFHGSRCTVHNVGLFLCFSAVGRSEGSLFAQPEATFVKEV